MKPTSSAGAKSALSRGLLALFFLAAAVSLPMLVAAAPASAAAAPTVTGLSLQWGPTSGGRSVVVTGTDFTGVTGVSFGTTAATVYTVDSSTKMTVTTPAHAMGLVQVRVTTVAGSSADTAADDYNYTVRVEAPTTSAGGFYYYPSVGPAGGTAAWQNFNAGGASGGSYERTSRSGAYVTLKFTGTYIVWIATAGVTTGYATVSVDGGTERIVDLARATTNYQQGVWKSRQLAYGPHTVKITWAGPSGKYIGIDAVDVAGTIQGGPQVTTATVISHGPRTAKNIALTFDMGGRLDPAVSIVNWLVANKVHATIFPTGVAGTQNAIGLQVLAVIKAHPDILDLGNHGWDHTDFTTMTKTQMLDQITRTEAALSPLAGQSSRPWFRPPYGAYNASVVSVCGSAGWKYLVMWDVSTGDWKPVSDGGPTTTAIVNRINTYAQNGSIVLMHLGGYNTLAALPGIINVLKAKGLQPVTLTEMFGL